MKLSILICSLVSRSKMLHKLHDSLTKQIDGNEEVEILCNVDSGEMSIGKKRNDLVASSIGEYICFVDDDDEVSEDYVPQILKAIESGPDCVAFYLKYYSDGMFIGIAHHSIKYFGWRTLKEDYGLLTFERTPNHLNPIKSSIAKIVQFPEVNHGEDHAWSNEIRQYLHSETEIKSPIYNYQHVSKK